MGICFLCAGPLRELLHFENFPSSAEYVSPEDYGDFTNGMNLTLVQCQKCAHVQLATASQRPVQYVEKYSYRSNNHSNRTLSTEEIRSKNMIEEFVQKNQCKCILEIGANNLSFIGELDFDGKKIAIDPLLRALGPNEETQNVEIIADKVEETNTELLKNVDFFISRHNLEHLENPISVLEKIRVSSVNKDIFGFIEVPDTDSLVRNCRFDQIFHEHIHYFNRQSLSLAINIAGFEVLEMWLSSRYGGSISALVKFSRSSLDKNIIKTQRLSQLIKYPVHPVIETKDLINSSEHFFNKCSELRNLLENVYGNAYGYGAGHSTPFLAYHIDGRYHLLEGIADNDVSKHGMFIKNLNPLIISPEELNKDHFVLITATDYTEMIKTSLHEKKLKNILGILL